MEDWKGGRIEGGRVEGWKGEWKGGRRSRLLSEAGFTGGMAVGCRLSETREHCGECMCCLMCLSLWGPLSESRKT